MSPNVCIRAEPWGYVDGETVQQVQNDDLLIDKCHAIGPELVVVDSLPAVSVQGENNAEDLRALQRPE